MSAWGFVDGSMPDSTGGHVFVQVIQGQVADANAVRAVLQRWIDPGRDMHHARPLRVRGSGAAQQ